jgi:hypothetical protein
MSLKSVLAVTAIIAISAIIFKTNIQHVNVATTEPNAPGKVFQIGFDKCGTMTLWQFFKDNGIASIHHGKGKLAVSMHNNHINNKPLIAAKYAHYIVYTDMERLDADQPIDIGMTLFQELDRQYPGSKFILNTRDKKAWLKSRSMSRMNIMTKQTLLHRTARRQQKSLEQVLEQWSKEWDEHHKAVIAYFKDRPQDLLVFNIETDPPEKLCEFFKDQFILDPKLYSHVNKTIEKTSV